MAETHTNPAADEGLSPADESYTVPVQITSSPTIDGVPTAVMVPQQGVSLGQVAENASRAEAQIAGKADIDNEQTIWTGGYSAYNFVGSLAILAVVTVAWLVLAIATWGYQHPDFLPITLIAGLAVLAYGLGLASRMISAVYGHSYRLSDRRLFVSTGVMRRRKDQMELLRVKDVFIRQTLMERWRSLGTVVVVSSEAHIPVFSLSGVEHPSQVMDLVWKHARLERDLRSTKIDQV